jgi:hypothetical protein
MAKRKVRLKCAKCNQKREVKVDNGKNLWKERIMQFCPF